MTTPIWPAVLPQKFLREGFAEEGQDNLIVSDMSVGPRKSRARSTSAVYPISGAMIMTEAQFAELKTFIRTEIQQRALPFTFPDPHGGAALLVRMTRPYSIAPIGVQWRVQIVLEVLP
ncbi:hypothetical protein ACXHXM_01960